MGPSNMKNTSSGEYSKAEKSAIPGQQELKKKKKTQPHAETSVYHLSAHLRVFDGL